MRSSRQRRDHLIAVVGDAEIADGSVQVTDVTGGFRGSVATAVFIGQVRDAYENRMAHVTWESGSGVRRRPGEAAVLQSSRRPADSHQGV